MPCGEELGFNPGLPNAAPTRALPEQLRGTQEGKLVRWVVVTLQRALAVDGSAKEMVMGGFFIPEF